MPLRLTITLLPILNNDIGLQFIERPDRDRIGHSITSDQCEYLTAQILAQASGW
jgi:hypothetical protein